MSLLKFMLMILMMILMLILISDADRNADADISQNTDADKTCNPTTTPIPQKQYCVYNLNKQKNLQTSDNPSNTSHDTDADTICWY